MELNRISEKLPNGCLKKNLKKLINNVLRFNKVETPILEV